MKRVLAGIVIVLQLAGCANHRKVDTPPSLEAVQRQKDALHLAIHQDHSAQILAEQDGWYVTQRLEVFENGVAFRYSKLVHQPTNTQFGVITRDGKMVSLLTQERADQLHHCLTPFNLDKPHWSQVSFASLATWAAEHSIANDDDALARTETVRRYEDESRLGETRRAIDTALVQALTLAVYAPFLIVSVPYVLMFDDTDEEAVRKQIEMEKTFLESLVLGKAIRADDRLPPDATYSLGTMTVNRYSTFAYRVKDDRVFVIEAPELLELYERQGSFSAWYERDDCDQLLAPAELKQKP